MPTYNPPPFVMPRNDVILYHDDPLERIGNTCERPHLLFALFFFSDCQGRLNVIPPTSRIRDKIHLQPRLSVSSLPTRRIPVITFTIPLSFLAISRSRYCFLSIMFITTPAIFFRVYTDISSISVDKVQIGLFCAPFSKSQENFSQTKKNEPGWVPNSFPNILIKFLSKLLGALHTADAFHSIIHSRHAVFFRALMYLSMSSMIYSRPVVCNTS